MNHSVFNPELKAKQTRYFSEDSKRKRVSIYEKCFEVMTNIFIFAFRFEKTGVVENSRKTNRSCMWQTK